MEHRGSGGEIFQAIELDDLVTAATAAVPVWISREMIMDGCICLEPFLLTFADRWVKNQGFSSFARAGDPIIRALRQPGRLGQDIVGFTVSQRYALAGSPPEPSPQPSV